jgi:BirA family biotin operon repressor/biotin-[acetyl-CoA-carboxylase] ligase
VIEIVAETGSTSADLAARLRDGQFVPERQWLVADRQTAGRGRQGREWLDGAGNFMGSTVVHRRFGDPDAATLALVAGLALYEAIRNVVPANAGIGGSLAGGRGGLDATGPGSSPGRRLMLKWPNDVMIGGAKLAGVLLERVEDSVVVGIGVNLAYAPALADRETVALGAPDRDGFAADLARQFDIELDRWRSFGLAPIVARWCAAAHPPGTRLAVGEPGETPVEGTFAGLTEDGALQLRLADGATRVIQAGEVRLLTANL